MPVAESPVQIALKRILVATDFSECSKRALLTGLGIAQRYASTLHVVHVVPSEGYGIGGAGMLGAVNFARHNARDLESEFLQKGYFEGIRYQISVDKGDVWPAVSRLVEEEHVDLVVVGTREAEAGWASCCLGRLRRRSSLLHLPRPNRRSQLRTIISPHRAAQERAFPDGFLASGGARPSVRRFAGAGT